MKTMSDQATNLLTMTKPRKISYAFMAIMLAVVASMHLATPLLTVLFSLFCLHIFNFGGRKFLASGLFVCVCAGILMGLLSIIPELGPMIGAVLAIAVAMVEGSGRGQSSPSVGL